MAKAIISPRQRELLKLLAEYIDKHGYAPSRREVAKLFGVTSTNTIQGLLQHLVEAGLVNVGTCVARALSVTPKGREALQ